MMKLILDPYSRLRLLMEVVSVQAHTTVTRRPCPSIDSQAPSRVSYSVGWGCRSMDHTLRPTVL